ncbi:type III secretion protein C [Pseudomonas sp. F-14 TE3623]|uniref:Type 3 secretion system secretin n=1 Tax=Pseudomonas farris TaxID=2841207 RepID=A0ABS6PWV2_9PSED|nr:type III secretion system outer membrane ring subunit SctC [Pseudomonas farris]
MFRRLCGWSLLSALAWPSPATAAVPEQWRQSPYAYEATQTPLATVLADFANSFGVSLDVGGVSGVVDAKIRSANAQEFLDRLALEHQFQWFLYNGKLYISPQNTQSARRLEVSADAVPDLKQALTDIGLLDKRFGWGELPDEGMVLVSGPARYVELVRNFSKEKVKAEDKQQIMMFPLRYATVADRKVNYRDQSITIPGVANILDDLLSSRSSRSVTQDPQANIQALKNMSDFSRNKIMSSANERTSGQAETNGSKTSSKTSSNRRVAADVRNNAVLIFDNPEKRPIYEQLIAQLDVPRNLVEIDAIILDIDRTQLWRLESRWGGRAGSVQFGSNLLTGGASTLSISDFNRFFADIQALEGQGVASVVAQPSVLTLENQPAVIDFSRTAYIQTTGERVANVQPVTAGTSLQVIPRSIPGGEQNRFQLIVDIEDGQLEQSQDDAIPGVKKGTVSTQAVISENRSLVIGGFHVDESADHNDRVPILGSLPLIGSFFSSKRQNVSKRERMFILTPKLIGDQVDPARYVAAENKPQLDTALARARQPDKTTLLREAISVAFADLAKGRVPGNAKEAVSGAMVHNVCRVGPGLVMDPKRGQWFSGADFDIAVGVVRNASDHPELLDEAFCAGSQTLAVTVSPRARLQPGESVEVFIALRPAVTPTVPGRTSRVSMLPL